MSRYVLRYVGISGTAYYWGRKRWHDNIHNATRYSNIRQARRVRRGKAPYMTAWFVPFKDVQVVEVEDNDI